MDDRPEKLSECGLLSPTSHLRGGIFPLLTCFNFMEKLTDVFHSSLL